MKLSKIQSLIKEAVEDVILREYSIPTYKDVYNKLKKDGWNETEAHYMSGSLINMEKRFSERPYDRVEFYIMREQRGPDNNKEYYFKDILYITGVYKGAALEEKYDIHTLNDIYNILNKLK